MKGNKIMNKLVSVVIPVYNMGDTLEYCVLSVLNQDYMNLEIILVNDGSTDNSFNICCELEKRDNRITAYHTQNKGSGPARNFGIEKAKGEYIFFPDADDYMTENAITELMDATENGKHDLIVFGYKVLTINNDLLNTKRYTNKVLSGLDIRNNYSDYISSVSVYGIQGAPWNKFFSMSIIKNNKVTFPNLRRHQDEGFIARYMCYSESVKFINPILYIHYANDLSKEWDKYPINYIDSVVGLHQIWQSTILSWNSNDSVTHDKVSVSFISGVIKALELSFSPKFCFDKKSRKDWFIKVINISMLKSEKSPKNLGKYQKIVLFLIRNKTYNILYGLLWLKVLVEKTGLLQSIKKYVLK